MSFNKFITRTRKGLINGVYVLEEWYDGSMFCRKTFKDDLYKILHSEDEPALINYYDDSTTIRSKFYYKDDLVHRDNDLPAVTSYYDNKSVCSTKWLIGGKYHRSNGPAHVDYFKSGKVNHEYYYFDGVLHNTHGPALIDYKQDGTISCAQYFINGKKLTHGSFLKKYFPIQYEKYIREKIYKINSKKYKLTSMNGKQLVFTEI